MLLCTAVGFSSCGDDPVVTDDTVPTDDTTVMPGDASMSAQIEVLHSSGENIAWEAVAPTATVAGGNVTISGTDASNREVIIVVAASGTGTYPVATGSVYNSTLLTMDAAYDTGISGSVEITKFDNTNNVLSGTFTFSGQLLISSTVCNITGGEFTDVAF